MLRDRDRDLARALVFAVRFFSLQQISRLWPADPRNTHRRLKQLIAAGWITTRWIAAQSPPPEIAVPLATWRPGRPLPHAGRLSWATRRRYAARPPRRMTAYRAGSTALRYFATRQVKLKPSHYSHDLAVAELFVETALRTPRAATLWLGEDSFPREHCSDEAVWDAELVRGGRVLTAFEVGHYKPRRFANLFRVLEQRHIPFRVH